MSSKFILILIFDLTNINWSSTKNNICKNFIDYAMNMDNNPNCWFDPELYMNTSQVLNHKGYKFEQYDVETEDGYILTIIRLPQPDNIKRKGVIVFVPPMFSSADCFIGMGNESVGLCNIDWSLTKKNVCKNFSDYIMNMDNNPNCWYDPELYMNTSQILSHKGYKFEQYDVETDDGYFITILRLPQPENIKRKGVILLMPPLFSSCDCFIGMGNESMAFMTWDSGYEVWLGNFRGTVYGQRHRKYDPDKDMEYWRFSFHEMGKYDIAAIVQFISSISGDFEISLVGYSMGSTAALIYGSLRPDHALKYMKSIALWAPTANMKHTRLLTKQLFALVNLLEILGPQGLRDLAPHNRLYWDLLSICREGPLVFVCLSVDFYIFQGQDPNNVRADWFPFKLGHNPGGVAYHVVAHFLQLADTGIFREYDYGIEENLKLYNSTQPPNYPIENIRTPVILIHGTLDLEAPEIDVLALYKRFSPEAAIYKPIKLIGMHHGGFVYNKIAPQLAYVPTIELFDKIYGEN